MEIQLHSEQFEGSLDLLLFLVKKRKMNPLELKISEITDEFIEYVNGIEQIDIEVASDFILMASILMEIKSRMLLNPSPDVIEKQEEIAKKLYEYSIVKDSAKKIENLYDEHSKEIDITVLPMEVPDKSGSIPESFGQIVRSVKKEMELRKRIYRISKDVYSFSKKMEIIKAFMVKRKRSSITEILSMSKDKLEVVVSFVTILELLRLKFLLIDSKEGVVLNENGDSS
jgi:segregation and condensation protein A|uniref:Segregation and condensation protein A n=1 Tax=Mesoaciditoga lauensis TaxID=1495039 RepID=A0A7V3VSQ2_9BACT